MAKPGSSERKKRGDDKARSRPKAEEPKAREDADDPGDADEEARGEAEQGDEPDADRGDDVEERGEADEDEREAAARVARALGVEEDSEVAEGGEETAAEAKPAPNRAARRKEVAEGRKKKLARDRNAKAKELLQRRREQAAERAQPGSLQAEELVGDVLARTASRTTKWVKANAGVLQWVVLAAVVAGGAFAAYAWRSDAKAEVASSLLAKAVAADRGVVLEEDKRPDEQKERDPTRVFKTADERAQTALAAYNAVIDNHGGSGAAILAKLGQAGVHFEQRQYAPAAQAYEEVLKSSLASADRDVRARALEGLGLAKEGAGDLEGALARFRELQTVEARGFKELGMYHEARVLVAKGEKDKAKELLKAAREKLALPTAEGKVFPNLEAAVTDALRALDPSAAPARPQLGGAKGAAPTREELERILREAMPKGIPGGEPGHEEPGGP